MVGEGSSQMVLVFDADSSPVSDVPVPHSPRPRELPAGRAADPRTCDRMLQCYAQGPGAPVTYPSVSLLASAEGSEAAPAAMVLALCATCHRAHAGWRFVRFPQ